ncbi:MAG: alkaline phosphatase family protein [Chloroflexota bacterium]
MRSSITRKQLLQAFGGGLGLAFAGGLLDRAFSGASKSDAADHLVLIVLDGARPEYFNFPGIPNVRRLIRDGTQYTNAFSGILESETPPAHVSIATGCEPRHNGVVNFWWGSPRKHEISLFDPVKINDGDMEAIVRKAGVPTIASLVHEQRPGSKVVALSGSKYYAADALGGPDSDATMYFYGTPSGQFVPTAVPMHEPPAGVLTSPGLTTKNYRIPTGVENHLAMKLAVDTFNRMRQQVTLINMPEFDWPLGHVDGGIVDRAKAIELMQSFDRDLGMLQNALRRAGVLDRTLFVLMADHGMIPLQRRIDSEVLDHAVEATGTSIVTSSYNTGACYWLQDSSQASAAAKNIAVLKSPLIQAVYSLDRTAQVPSYRRVSDGSMQHDSHVETANQYLLSTFVGPNAPDVMVAFAEGVGCEPGGQAGWKGDHGGASWTAQHLPLILSGPGVRENHVSHAPARLIDVAPTALQVLGVAPHGMRGTILADALEAPPGAAVHRQGAMTRSMEPVVQALQNESLLEVSAGA